MCLSIILDHIPYNVSYLTRTEYLEIRKACVGLEDCPTYFSGEGKRRNEFAEWHLASLVERHNYAECNICRMTKRNKLN